MADESYLNELLGQEGNPLIRGLLQESAKIIRNPNTNSADYPAHIRRIMDDLFKGVLDALDHPDSA